MGRIQSKSGSGAPTSALTLTLDAATTSGNTLVVAVSDYYATADPDTTISDSKSNTWKVAANYTNGARVKVYYAENIVGGSGHQITVRTTGGSAYFVATAMEYAGIVSAGSLDGTATNRSTATAYTSGAVTTQGPALLVGIHHVYAVSATFTPASGWTTVERRTDGVYHQHQVQEQIVVAPGTYSSTGTLPAAADTQSVVIALKAGIPDTEAPTPPTGLTATAISGTQIALSWTAATDNVAVTGYRVTRGGSVIATPTGTTYTDNGLLPATTYSYTVTALDAAGNASAPSEPQSATTGAPDLDAADRERDRPDGRRGRVWQRARHGVGQ